MIKAILFDLDGVIVDSLYFHYLAWENMFNKLGGSVSLNTVLLHEGRNSFEILPILMEESKIFIPEEDREKLINEKREYYRSIAKLTYYPEAFETIKELKNRGFKLALVTACARKNMELSVDKENQKLFDVIISGQDVAKAKPNPDPYLTAQQKLGLEINECVVIENAPLGVQAAKAANMICIGIESTLGREYLQKADFVVNEIKELTGFFPVLKR
ncbi:MAG: HAD family phosphatase [Bacteroidota bacterium]|nr:HAD family phosphatase [Bacteroidota bacterium]